MPAKFRIKNYQSGVYYHIYNKGIDDKDIFLDESDYLYFISLLRRYLVLNSPTTSAKPGFKLPKPSIQKRILAMNLSSELSLAAYCLMADHFHLLISQQNPDGITKLMRRVCTNYCMYFNKKYRRHGPLFENVYRAVAVETMEQAVHLSRFIHLNPVAKSVRRFVLVETVVGTDPGQYPYSSYKNYLGINDAMVSTDAIKTYLGDRSYKDFVIKDSLHTQLINNLTLDI